MSGDTGKSYDCGLQQWRQAVEASQGKWFTILVVLFTSAGGAAGGAAIGAIAGDAGTGAAIGATAGVVRGRRQQKKANKQAEQQTTEQGQAQQQQKPDTFHRSFSSCIDARGYSVK